MLKDVWVVCVSCKNNIKWYKVVLLIKICKICIGNFIYFFCIIII